MTSKRSPSPASNTASSPSTQPATSSGLLCCGTTPAPVKPAAQLVAELGAPTWAEATGLVPVASFTVTKLRWLADHEPANAERVAAVALPHDWLSWRLRGTGRLEDLTTDRSDASGTGYFDPVTNEYRRDLLAHALRTNLNRAEGICLPTLLGPTEGVQAADRELVIGPGCGDNAGAALGLNLAPGDVMVSIGTSGVVAAVSTTPARDSSGLVAGFADAAGHYLPLAATLNGSRILDTTAAVLRVDHAGLAELALQAQPGAAGLTLLPYFQGERTPNLPDATGTLSGLTLQSFTRENLARAAVEGLLTLLRGALEAIRDQGTEIRSVQLVGGGSRSQAVQQLAQGLLGVPVHVPASAEYVALGAARQAAQVLAACR